MLLPLYVRFLTGLCLVLWIILLHRALEYILLQNATFPDSDGLQQSGNFELNSPTVSTYNSSWYNTGNSVHSHLDQLPINNNRMIYHGSLISNSTVISNSTSDQNIDHNAERYTRSELLALRDKKLHLNEDTFNTIKSLGIDRRRRGRRAGSHMIKKNHSSSSINNENSSNQQFHSHNNSAMSAPPFKGNNSLTVHCWNANSIGNKDVILVDHIIDYYVDIMFLVETKLAPDETVILGQCTPPGYKFLSLPRPKRDGGGGIGTVYKENIELSITPSSFTTVNFEYCIATLKNSVQFVVVYHPPPSKVNGLKRSEFLEDFEVFLEKLSVIPTEVVLVGDYNIHVDEPHKPETRKFQ